MTKINDGDAQTLGDGSAIARADAKDDIDIKIVNDTSAKWLYGSGRCQFQIDARFGMGGVHRLSADLSVEQIIDAGSALRAKSEDEARHYYLSASIPRGRGRQVVQIAVPRMMMLGIAHAVADARDVEDAGHRFWHWQNPTYHWPCSECRETKETKNQRADAARADLVTRWAGDLHVHPSQVELLLSQYDQLPRRAS